MSFNILLFLHEMYVVEKPLEVHQWDSSNEYPQHMFSWRNKENIYLDIPLFWSYAECVMCMQIWANTANLLQAHNFVQLQLTLVILKFKGLSEVRDIGTSTYQICRTIKPSITIAAENFYFLFLRIRSWHFMWIISLADALHDNVKTYFLWKINNNK